ncbi:MAG: F0F1 ATP synthase subunit epsilon [Ignavibacteriae bacterium]|nr:F0F1 ATP synthase subunit epsilon [Ignavibacteriota bacterium]
MAEKAIKVEIVTPRKAVFSGEAVSFSAPGVMGGFQVLYNHAPMLAEIGIGEVTVQDVQGKGSRFATSGGFVDVFKNHIVMLAESAERREEIDIARAEAAKERAMKRLAERSANIDHQRARAALNRALNRLRFAQKV